jgi:hypothetical protein
MSADNGKYLISLGTDNIHTYKIESNGAVGKQAGEIDTQKYSGVKCGTISGGGLLDHTGKYVYVSLWSPTAGEAYSPICSALQTYKIESNGELTFLGDTESFEGDHNGAYQFYVGTISSNDKLGYGLLGQDGASTFMAFKADANGALLMDGSFSEVDPEPDPSVPDSNYLPLDVAADPASHLAVLMNEPFTNTPPPQLASYTINDTTGAIVSTNTWADMPTPQLSAAAFLEMSPSGKLLVVGGDEGGIQIFHFNGAAPITPYSGVLLPNIQANQLTWDNNNHLYVLSYLSGEICVFTVTPTSISEVSASPYKIPGLTGMIVVPK